MGNDFDNNYHKQQCEELRQIRVKMADILGVPYVVRKEPCNFKGECSGTCPACYMEEKALMERIYELAIDGRLNMFFGEDIKLLEEEVNGASDIDEIEMGDIMIEGDITPYEFDNNIELIPTTASKDDIDNLDLGKPVSQQPPLNIPPFNTPLSGQIIPPPWAPNGAQPELINEKTSKEKKDIKIPGFLKGNKK